jgi:hypothetical protein
MNYTNYTLSDLHDMYTEAKFMAFMCLHASDRGNWHKWCRTAADINLSIHIKSQEIAQ